MDGAVRRLDDDRVQVLARKIVVVLACALRIHRLELILDHAVALFFL